MRWTHHFRIGLIIFISVMLISAAVIFSVLRATLPYATGYKAEIQQEISRQIGLPVEIGSIDAAIHWFSPRLKLLDVSVLDKDNKIHLFEFEEAFVELDTMTSLLRGEVIIGNVGLVGTRISIEKLSDKDWLVQGIKFSSEGDSEVPEQLIYMLKNSDYLLHDSDILYQDHTGDKLNVSLLDVNINVVNRFNMHDIKLSTNLPSEYGENLAIVANLSGDFDSLYGDIYVEANAVNINQWNNKFKLLKDYQLDSIVDVAVWATLQGNEISRLTTSFTAQNFTAKNVATNKSWQTNFLSADMQYAQAGDNRQLSISNFSFGEKTQAAWGRSVALLAGETKTGYYLDADFLRFSDLNNIAGLVLDSEINEKFKNIQSYKLQGDVYNLSLRSAKSEVEKLDNKVVAEIKKIPQSQFDELSIKAGQSSDVQTTGLEKTDAQVSIAQAVASQSAVLPSPEHIVVNNFIDGLYIEATVNNFSANDEKNKISLNGLDAIVHFENNVANIKLVTKDAAIGFNKLFRSPIITDLISGDIFFTFTDNSWEMSSNHLQVKNRDINTYTRLHLYSDASAVVSADIQTDFYDAYTRHAHKYLPVGIMRKGLVSWLDSALTNGYVPAGKFILNGDLKDFPFRDNNGVFQVLFSAKNLNMKYLEEWPILKNTSAQIKFNNASLDITGVKTTTQNSLLYGGTVRINNLTDPYLKVGVNTHAKNTDIQSYIWNSPLDDKLGKSMRLFHLAGNSDLKLKLGIPLNGNRGEMLVDGHLVFRDAEFYYPEMSYAINRINGAVEFTNDSIFSDSLDAFVEGNRVSISADTLASDNGNQINFQLDGVINADYLLSQYDWVPDHWFSGSSLWAIDLSLPASGNDILLQVKASTSLENVVVDISDAVHKNTAERINLNTTIKVLKDNKFTIDVKTDVPVTTDAVLAGNERIKVVDLSASFNENKVWNIDVDSEYLSGVAEFVAGLSKDSQITLDLDKVNLSALLVTKGERQSNKSLKPTDFPALDWKADKVIWSDWVFSDAVLSTDWNRSGMLIKTLQLKNTAFLFDASGSWLTSQQNFETVLHGGMTSNNLGEALTAFGYERSIDRSNFDATFNIKWPAEPYALTWDNMTGTANFSMQEGEILDVNPGASGRLLGLMNIFKLTNRLAFDFDDVYRKGFSFDSITGDLEFKGGQGSLKKFDISAPAADINMFGSIGLAKQDYNLLMHVKPHTDTLTFAGGVLIGGVAVGAGLALIQKIFDLGVIGHNVYSITGSWDDPVTEKIVDKTQSTTEDEDY